MTMSPELRRELQRKDRGPCPRCNEPHPSAMTKHGVCYACFLAASGKKQVEQHHPIGRRNGTETVTMPANLHRALSAAQFGWPDLLKTNPEGDPLITFAQILRAVGDFAEWLAERAERMSDWLLALSIWLRSRLGGQWWADFTPLW